MNSSHKLAIGDSAISNLCQYALVNLLDNFYIFSYQDWDTILEFMGQCEDNDCFITGCALRSLGARRCSSCCVIKEITSEMLMELMSER